MAILSSLDTFLSVNSDDDVVCQNKSAGPAEFLSVRCILQRNDDSDKDVPEEEKGSLAEVEENYV